jgi:TRAP-type C4-dicarboxylate transport system permease small subunit
VLNAIDAALETLNRVLMAFTAVLILAMAAAVTADVLGRNLSLFALPWSSELSEYGLYLSAVLISPWLLRRGQHISVGVLVDALPARAGAVIAVLGDLLCAAVSAILGWYALQALLRSQSDQSLVIKNVVFPEWWLLVPITFIFFLLTVEFLVQGAQGRPASTGDLPA